MMAYQDIGHNQQYERIIGLPLLFGICAYADRPPPYNSVLKSAEWISCGCYQMPKNVGHQQIKIPDLYSDLFYIPIFFYIIPEYHILFPQLQGVCYTGILCLNLYNGFEIVIRTIPNTLWSNTESIHFRTSPNRRAECRRGAHV